MKRITILIFSILAALTVTACTIQRPSEYDTQPDPRALLDNPPAYPMVTFAVMTDLHTYDPSLGTDGTAFKNYVNYDYKLAKESAEILQTAVGQIESENVSFVLITGDLTDHGDRDTHELVASYLRQLEEHGKKVYVIPGNHDIDNSNAVEYAGDQTLSIRNVSAGEFAQIYGDFGYNGALYRDPASLSYVAEPQKGLWLLALDSCIYMDKPGETTTVTGGRFSSQTLEWIEDMLVKAAQANKAVIALEHHPIVEHFDGMAKDFPEYVLQNYQTISRLFAEYNVRLVFTGHFHAQDIARKAWPDTNKFLFDVETGSLVTYPCPYRLVNIDAEQNVSIHTAHIQSIPSHPVNLQDYAEAQLDKGLTAQITAMIARYGLNSVEATRIAKDVAHAVEAHMAGDETLPAGRDIINEKGLSLPAWIAVQIKKGTVESLWKDLPPPDNDVSLDMGTGNWR